MNNYIVYKRTNKINNKVYIGKTLKTLDERWANGKGYRGSIKFYSAIEKYGPENFTHEILKDNLTKEEADYWEEYYLEVVGHGINKVSGKPINFVGKQTGFLRTRVKAIIMLIIIIILAVLTIGVFIEQNLVKITSIAINKLICINFFTSNFLSINFLLFWLVT